MIVRACSFKASLYRLIRAFLMSVRLDLRGASLLRKVWFRSTIKGFCGFSATSWSDHLRPFLPTLALDVETGAL